MPTPVRPVRMLVREGAKQGLQFLLLTDTGKAQDMSRTVIEEDKTQDLKRVRLQPEFSEREVQCTSRPVQLCSKGA